MREILFRGKGPDKKKWIEGYYQKRYDAFNNIQHLICYSKSSVVWGNIEVDPKSVGEYTGLSNGNDKKYEWDIFEASDGDFIQRYVITWNEDALEWSAQCITDPEGTLPLSEFRVSEIDVIGNIFDNPELLGSEAN